MTCWKKDLSVCLSLLMKSKQKKIHQHSAPGHLIMSHPLSTPCTDPLVEAAWSEWPSVPQKGQDPWGRVWGGGTILWQQQTASLHPVFARTTAKAAASGKHPPHSVKVEVLWGTDVLRVSSSVSSKRPQQPSPVGRQDLCSGSVNGKKIVAAFQGHEWSTATVVPNWKQQLKSNNSLAFSVFPYLGIWAEQKSYSCWWGQSQAKAGRFQTNIFRVVEFYSSQWAHSVVHTLTTSIDFRIDPESQIHPDPTWVPCFTFFDT